MSTIIYSNIIKNSRQITNNAIPMSIDTFGPYAVLEGQESEHKKVSQ